MSVNVMKERRPVRDGYLVKVGVLAVEEECVRAPDLVQELPVHGQLTDQRRAVVDLDQSEASIVSSQPIRGEYCQKSTNHSLPGGGGPGRRCTRTSACSHTSPC